MEIQELYLKTAFCCMACDGDIATEELDVIKGLSDFHGMDLLPILDGYIRQLKEEGGKYLEKYLDEVKDASLSEDEECELARIAIKTIEADQSVEYNEVAFFKKIRKRLKASDERLLEVIPEDSIMPDREDYLMPDISDENDFSLWADTFTNIAIEKN